MNIFYLDRNIKKCAEYHCDKHVVKMILEYTQLLCSALWMNGIEAPYKLTHKNHPCAKWVRNSSKNYDYLIKLLLNLHQQYFKRYNKIHKSFFYFEFLDIFRPKLKNKNFIDPPQCMPKEYKNKDTVLAYRNYYLGDKMRFAKWKNKKPNWILKSQN
mgnify:CR=1 FL=1